MIGQPGYGNRKNAAAAAFVALVTLAMATPSRATEVHFRGLLDLVGTNRGPAFDQNILTRGDSRFDPTGLRMFAEGNLNDRTHVFAQAVFYDASGVYLDGAYLMYSPFRGHDLNVQAGKIPWAIGTWAPRTYSNKNPLIGVPLIYSHQTSLLWADLPASADALLNAAGTGPYGVGYNGYTVGRGMPVVDDCYWDVGITVTGSERPLEYALGISSGSPGWASTGQDDNKGKSVLGRIGLAPYPGVRFGVSGSYGPYLGEWLDPKLPAGHTVNEYAQKLVMADLELLAGRVELRAEGVRNFWETPTVGELAVTGGYGELKVASPWGAFIAGRYDLMNHSTIVNSAGEALPWDDNVTRAETGLGYRFSRDVTAKVVFQRTHYEHEATDSYHNLDLFAGQLSVGF